MPGHLTTDLRPAATPAHVLPHDDPNDPNWSAPTTTQPALPTDPDDVALDALRQAAVAEEGGDQPEPQAPQGAAQAPQQRAKGPMVPKARLDEALRAASDWKSRALYMEGAMSARQQQQSVQPQPQAPRQPAPQQPSVAEQVLALQQQKLVAAERFDRGEITAVDLTRAQIQADNAISNLRDRALVDHVSQRIPAATAPGLADQQILNDHTVALEDAHPWLEVFRAGEIEFLRKLAEQEQAALATPIGSGPAETLRLRHAIAELSDTYGPRWFPPGTEQHARVLQIVQARQQQQPQTGNPTAPVNNGRRPSPQPQPGASPAFVRRFAAHPPDINAAGTGAVPDELSEERLNTMSTEELAALPDAIRARYL